MTPFIEADFLKDLEGVKTTRFNVVQGDRMRVLYSDLDYTERLRILLKYTRDIGHPMERESFNNILTQYVTVAQAVKILRDNAT